MKDQGLFWYSEGFASGTRDRLAGVSLSWPKLRDEYAIILALRGSRRSMTTYREYLRGYREGLKHDR